MKLSAYVLGKPESLTMEEALFIRAKKRGCTWRRLALDVLGEESQMNGKWLAEDAIQRITGKPLRKLYEDGWDDHFYQENISHYGDFFWWE